MFGPIWEPATLHGVGATRRAGRERPQPPTRLRGALRGDPSEETVRPGGLAEVGFEPIEVLILINDD